MNYKDWTIPRLKELPQLEKALDNIPERIKVLEAEYTNIRAVRTDATPVHGGTNTREEMLIANIAEREELSARYDIAKRNVEQMRNALADLEPNERKALEMFYIHRCKNHVERLCAEFGYEKSQVYAIKDEALIKLAKILYGCAEL